MCIVEGLPDHHRYERRGSCHSSQYANTPLHHPTMTHRGMDWFATARSRPGFAQRTRRPFGSLVLSVTVDTRAFAGRSAPPLSVGI